MDSIGIFDSHTHRPFGALVAVSKYGNLEHFCEFVVLRFFHETLKVKPEKMVG